MGKLLYGASISLDGFVAGANQSVDDPLGVRGQLLHEWLRELAVWRERVGLEGGAENESTALVEQSNADVGAYIMGRNMFGGGRGPWPKEPWNGWWGDEPPYHVPVFVLTHHPREPLHMAGGTSFIFVQDGIDAALEQAREAAGDRDISIAGGAAVAKQYLAAGLIDEMTLSYAPVFLGEGERLFDDPGLGGTTFEQVRVVEAPGVTHVKYRTST
jgi:dihydrofolate reductase